MKIDYTRLKALRKEKELTQNDMGELLCMTQSNYNKLENGHKMNDSIHVIENLAKAFKMPKRLLMGILTNQENIQSSGMGVSELMAVERVLKNTPLREDEFIFFSTELLEIEKHDFKEDYSGLNLAEYDGKDPFSMPGFPPEMKIIIADSVEVGFEYEKEKLSEVSIWLADKKLGVIPIHNIKLVKQLINALLISRVVLVENEDGVPGFFETYMKVVFIATNAEYKSAEYKYGRFSSFNFMSEEEVKEMDNENF